MNENLTQPLAADSREMQNMIVQAMSETIKSLPKPKVPSWMEGAVEFVKIHPWVSLIIVFAVIFIISAIIREILCSYFKTNEVLERLKRIEEKLK